MKRIWKGLGVAAIALVLGAGALVFFAPVGGFKAPLEAEVASATGRAFHIEGPVRLTFTPELALDLGPVTLGAGQGPDATPLVAARRAVLAVAFLPLLSGDARATGLTLEGADIQIGRGGEGWIFTAADGAQTGLVQFAFPVGLHGLRQFAVAADAREAEVVCQCHLSVSSVREWRTFSTPSAS